MASAVLNVPDISCEHCERTITSALRLPRAMLVLRDSTGLAER